MSVIDQYNDPAFGILYKQLSQMPALEAFVKTASVDTSEAASLPDTAFAWPSERKFPVHTPAHAALSYAYFKAASEYMPPSVEADIKTALEVFGIKDEVFQFTKTAAVELREEDYLIPDLKLLPVKTAAEVISAQNRLVESMSKLDLEHRATACANLVKKASEHSVSLHPEIRKLAGFVVSSTQETRRWLEARANRLPDSEKLYKEAYTKLAEGLERQAPESKDREGLLKLASTIANLDEKSGLDKHYDRKLPDALRTVFNTEKQSSAMVDLGGTMVALSKIAALPASFWDDLGGSELSDEIAPGGVTSPEKVATVVDTLPLDLKLIIRKQLRA